MGTIEDLITKPVSELSDEELEQRILLMKRLRLESTKPKRKIVSNKTKKDTNLLNNLNEDSLRLLQTLLKEKNLL